MPSLLYLAIPMLLVQLYTMWHIWTGDFPGRWEKRRLLLSTLNLPLFGLVQYWTHSVHRRRTRHDGYIA